LPFTRHLAVAASSAPTASRPGATSVPRIDPHWEYARDNLGRKFAFYFGLGLIFLRFSMLHELLAQVFEVNLYPLYVLGPPAILGVLFSGGIRRTFRARAAWCWTAFFAWMALATPFSIWKGGSADLFYTYAKSEFPMLLVTAGLAVTWAECRRMLHVIAASGVCYVAVARVFMGGWGTRVGVTFGSTANPNDLAAHQLLVLPFVLFLSLDANKPMILRLIALPAAGLGLYLIPATGSRGALLALVGALAFILLRGTWGLRLAVLVLVVAGAVLLPLMIPTETYRRLTSFKPEEGASLEALMSSDLRERLLKDSITVTLHHPILGVGPGQFDTADNALSIARGEQRGLWKNTHNVYTQISSECGIPALIFYLSGIISTFLLLNRICRQARRDPRHRQIATAAFCMMLSMIGFCVAITFLTIAYRFYLPAMAGLAIALSAAAAREFSDNGTGTAGADANPVVPGLILRRSQRSAASAPRPRSSR
jgi:O-antigen ligase